MRHNTMRWLTWGWLAVATLWSEPWVVRAAGQDTPPARPAGESEQPASSDAEWVERLGASEFRERDQARLVLESRGLEAAAALRAGLESDDPEVRRRCEVILRRIDTADKHRRLDQLVALGEAAAPQEIDRLASELELPGWDVLARYAGHSVQTRQLYREIMVREWEFIRESAEDPRSAPQLLSARIDELAHQPLIDSPIATIHAFVLSSLIAGEISDIASTRLQTTLRDNAYGARTAGERGRPIRQMLSGWVTDVRGGPMNHFHALAISRTYRLAEAGAERARMVLRSEMQAGPIKPTGLNLVQMALLTLMEFGKPSDVELLEQIIDNGTVTVVTMRSIGGHTQPEPNGEAMPRMVLEVRVADLAMFVALILEGRDVRQFGFAHIPPGDPRHFFDSYVGFADNKQRQAALELWKSRDEIKDVAGPDQGERIE